MKGWISIFRKTLPLPPHRLIFWKTSIGLEYSPGAFRIPNREPTGQEPADPPLPCHRHIIEVLRQHGPMTQKEIAAATGIAETSCGPLSCPMRRAGVAGGSRKESR